MEEGLWVLVVQNSKQFMRVDEGKLGCAFAQHWMSDRDRMKSQWWHRVLWKTPV
jgi:hypothetical protein